MSNQETIFWIVFGGLCIAVVGAMLIYCSFALRYGLRRLICSLRDHAGMSPTNDQSVWKCKKCGALVRL